MWLPNRSQRISAIVASCLAGALALNGPAKADTISTTPTLPLLDVPYAPATGAGCFATAGVCVSEGTLTLTSLVSSVFNPLGQDIVTNATYTATLTTLGNNPLGAVTLTGTIEQELLGRTFSTETGYWTADIVTMSLDGPVLGRTLTLKNDLTQTSSGTTSITPLGTAAFDISSFFDIFADLSLDGTTPLHTSVGPIVVTATPAPEPAGLAVLALPLLLLRVAGRWRQDAVIPHRPG